MNFIELKPVIRDGVEFYVSDDGSQLGMSISGIARLCDVGKTAIQSIVQKLSYQSSTWDTPESLKPFQGMESNRPLIGKSGAGNARVVSSDLCAAIIEYFAFESRNRTEAAMHVYRKFAKRGIDAWIQEVTGCESPEPKALLSAINRLISKVDSLSDEVIELKTQVKDYDKIRRTSQSQMPGMDELMTLIAENDENLLPAPQADDVTIAEWLLCSKKLRFETNELKAFGLQVAYVYRTLRQELPRKARVSGNYAVNVFNPSEFPILQIAFSQFIK